MRSLFGKILVRIFVFSVVVGGTVVLVPFPVGLGGTPWIVLGRTLLWMFLVGRVWIVGGFWGLLEGHFLSAPHVF